MDTYNIASYGHGDELRDKKLLWGFSSVPMVNFGASKLVARFTQLLLTKKGSDRTDPEAGCNIVDLIGSIHTSELGYIRNEVNTALSDLRAQMRFENAPGSPPEATFADAKCSGVSIEEDILALRFEILTRSDKPLVFVVPISPFSYE